MAIPDQGDGERRAAAQALVRERIELIRRRMRRAAILDQVTCRLAVRMNVRPEEAAAHLARLSHESGMDLLEVARSVDEQAGEPTEAPRVAPPEWAAPVMEAMSLCAMYLIPVTDETGRLVDFLVVATTKGGEDVTGRPLEVFRGRRLLEFAPGVMRAGLLEECIRVFETRESFQRGPFEYVEARDDRLWPRSISVRASRVEDGILLTWQELDEEERLVTGWERAQRIAGLGWAEWNLASGRIIWTLPMYEMFGRDAAEGPLPFEQLPETVVAEDLGAMEEVVRTLLEHRESVEHEFRVQQRHGIRHVRLAAEPVLDGSGFPFAVRAMAQDVTADRRRERALAEARDQTHRARHRAEEEHRVALALQDTIMPTHHGVFDLPGLHMGVRYSPSGELERLGGDWFKARPLPDGRVLVAIGDAMGHGLGAVSLMAQMRSGLAGLAYTGAPADRLARWLNELAFHANQNITVTGTAVIGHFTPATRTLEWVSAGHLPPVLVRDGKAVFLETSNGTMLGAFENMDYTLTTTQLARGDLLLLYTDGVVEQRGRSLDIGLNAMLDAAGRCAEGDPEKNLACVLRELGGEHATDDVCLLALRVL
ncbi:PP2C family protein-serine/threonine phosphatase [Streptosporangium sandarakinum]|uniref:PP2C family protein-serine/threonine phosphatase n=1 Tax=Streptosporangium sandarakinum TaxID=1260955 RepID=UPI003448394B